MNRSTIDVKAQFWGQAAGKGADFMPYLLTASVLLHAMHHLWQGAADFLNPFSDTGLPMVDLFRFLVVSARCPKNMFIERPQILRKSKKVAQGRRKDARTARGFTSQAATRATKHLF